MPGQLHLYTGVCWNSQIIREAHPLTTRLLHELLYLVKKSMANTMGFLFLTEKKEGLNIKCKMERHKELPELNDKRINLVHLPSEQRWVGLARKCNVYLVHTHTVQSCHSHWGQLVAIVSQAQLSIAIVAPAIHLSGEKRGQAMESANGKIKSCLTLIRYPQIYTVYYVILQMELRSSEGEDD